MDVAIKIYPTLKPNRIRRKVPSRSRIVIPMIVVMQPGFRIVVLPRKPQVEFDQGGRVDRRLAAGKIDRLPDDAVVRVGHRHRGADMIVLEKIPRIAGSVVHRQPVVAPVQVLAAGPLGARLGLQDQTAFSVVDEQDGHPLHALCHPLAKPQSFAPGAGAAKTATAATTTARIVLDARLIIFRFLAIGNDESRYPNNAEIAIRL